MASIAILPCQWSGRGDDHRIEIALVEQFAVVQVALHVELLGDHLLAFFVDVARGHDLAGVVLLAEGVERLGVVACRGRRSRSRRR